MYKVLMPLALAGAVSATACSSDAGGVDPDAINGTELAAVRTALDSAFLHDTTLDRAFTGDSGLYALMSTLVFPFIDRASRIPEASDTTRVVGIEFDISATQGGATVVSNLTAILAWKGYDAATGSVDTVFFVLGAGRAPISDSLWTRFTLDTAGTGTGFVIHQAHDLSVSKWLSRGVHLRTTQSQYRSGRSITAGATTLTIYRGTVNGELLINAKLVPDSVTAVASAKDFGGGARAMKMKIRGSL